MYSPTLSLTSALDEGGCPTPLPGGFTPREKPGTHCMGGWVGPRAGLDGCGKSLPTGIRSPERPASRESLHRLSYPGPHLNKYFYLRLKTSNWSVLGVPTHGLHVNSLINTVLSLVLFQLQNVLKHILINFFLSLVLRLTTVCCPSRLMNNYVNGQATMQLF